MYRVVNAMTCSVVLSRIHFDGPLQVGCAVHVYTTVLLFFSIRLKPQKDSCESTKHLPCRCPRAIIDSMPSIGEDERWPLRIAQIRTESLQSWKASRKGKLEPIKRETRQPLQTISPERIHCFATLTFLYITTFK